jgi:ribose transport system permease protein
VTGGVSSTKLDGERFDIAISAPVPEHGVSAPAPSADRKGGVLRDIPNLLSRYALIGVLLLLWLTFSLWNPRVFATVANLQSILLVQAGTAMIALGVLVPLVAGHFDLSAGFQFGLAQSLAAVLVTHHHWSPFLATVVVLGTGVGIGVVNGQLITRLQLPSFTTTLATGLIVLGFTEWVTANQIITGVAPTWFLNLGRGTKLGIPLPFWYLAIAAIVLFVLLELTVWGRRAYAVGANPTAARLSGVNSDRYVRHAFIVTGFLCAFAGLMSFTSLGASSPVLGLGSLLPAFAATFLGATCIRPGRYNVAGTVIAVYTIGVGIIGLQQKGAQSYVQDMFNGAALLIAIVISISAQRRRSTA